MTFAPFLGFVAAAAAGLALASATPASAGTCTGTGGTFTCSGGMGLFGDSAQTVTAGTGVTLAVTDSANFVHSVGDGVALTITMEAGANAGTITLDTGNISQTGTAATGAGQPASAVELDNQSGSSLTATFGGDLSTGAAHAVTVRASGAGATSATFNGTVTSASLSAVRILPHSTGYQNAAGGDITIATGSSGALFGGGSGTAGHAITTGQLLTIDNIIVTNAGKIIATNGRGVNLRAYTGNQSPYASMDTGNITITNSGTISDHDADNAVTTEAGEAVHLRQRGVNKVEVTNTGTISTTANSKAAIQVEHVGSGMIDINVTGGTVSGHGIGIEATGAASNGGAIDIAVTGSSTSVASTADGGGTAIAFTGGTSQKLTLGGGATITGDVTFSRSDATLQMTGAADIDGDLDFSAGGTIALAMSGDAGTDEELEVTDFVAGGTLTLNVDFDHASEKSDQLLITGDVTRGGASNDSVTMIEVTATGDVANMGGSIVLVAVTGTSPAGAFALMGTAPSGTEFRQESGNWVLAAAGSPVPGSCTGSGGTFNCTGTVTTAQSLSAGSAEALAVTDGSDFALSVEEGVALTLTQEAGANAGTVTLDEGDISQTGAALSGAAVPAEAVVVDNQSDSALTATFGGELVSNGGRAVQVRASGAGATSVTFDDIVRAGGSNSAARLLPYSTGFAFGTGNITIATGSGGALFGGGQGTTGHGIVNAQTLTQGTLTVTNAGKIIANHGRGINLRSLLDPNLAPFANPGNLTITNSGTISDNDTGVTVSSESGEAVHVLFKGTNEVDVTNTGTISTTRNDTSAIQVDHRGSGTIDINITGGTVSGHGTGIEAAGAASGGGAVDITVTGSSTTVSGTGGTAISFNGGASQLLTLGGGASITGDVTFSRSDPMLQVTGTASIAGELDLSAGGTIALAMSGDSGTDEALTITDFVAGGTLTLNVAFASGADNFDRLIIGTSSAAGSVLRSGGSQTTINLTHTGDAGELDSGGLTLVDFTGTAADSVADAFTLGAAPSGLELARNASGDWILRAAPVATPGCTGSGGTFTCQGAITAAQPLSVSSGELIVNMAAGTTTSADADFSFSGGERHLVNIAGGTTPTSIAGDLTSSGGDTSGADANRITLTGDSGTGGSLSLAGVEGFRVLRKDGAGSWTLTGAQQSTHPFSIVMFNAGVLRLQDATMQKRFGTAIEIDRNEVLEVVGTSGIIHSAGIVSINAGGVVNLSVSGDSTATDDSLELRRLVNNGGSVSMSVSLVAGGTDNFDRIIAQQSIENTSAVTLNVAVVGNVGDLDSDGLVLVDYQGSSYNNYADSDTGAFTGVVTLGGAGTTDLEVVRNNTGDWVLRRTGSGPAGPNNNCVGSGGIFNCAGDITEAQTLPSASMVSVAAGTTTTTGASITLMNATTPTLNFEGGTSDQGTTNLRGALVGAAVNTLNLRGGAGTTGAMSLDGLTGFFSTTKSGAGSWSFTGANTSATSMTLNFNGGVLLLEGATLWNGSAVGVDTNEILEVTGASEIRGLTASLSVNSGGEVDLTADGVNANDSLWVQRLVANGGSVTLNVALVSGGDTADTITVSGAGANHGITNTSAVTLNVAVVGDIGDLDSGGVMLVDVANVGDSPANAFTGVVTLNGSATSDLRVERDGSSGDWMLAARQSGPVMPGNCTGDGTTTLACSGSFIAAQTLTGTGEWEVTFAADSTTSNAASFTLSGGTMRTVTLTGGASTDIQGGIDAGTVIRQVPDVGGGTRPATFGAGHLNLVGGAGTTGTLDLTLLRGFNTATKSGAGTWILTGNQRDHANDRFGEGFEFTAGTIRLAGAIVRSRLGSMWTLNADRTLEVEGTNTMVGTGLSTDLATGGHINLATSGDTTPTNEILIMETLGSLGGMITMNVAFLSGTDTADQIRTTRALGTAMLEGGVATTINIQASGDITNADGAIVLLDTHEEGASVPAGGGFSPFVLGTVTIGSDNTDHSSSFQFGRYPSTHARGGDWVLVYTGGGAPMNVCPGNAALWTCSGALTAGGTITGSGNVVVNFDAGTTTTAAADITIAGGTSRTVNLTGGSAGAETDLQGDINATSAGTLNLLGVAATRGTLNWAGVSNFTNFAKSEAGRWTLTGAQTNAAAAFAFTGGTLRLEGATITQPNTNNQNWSLGAGQILEVVGENRLNGRFFVGVAGGTLGINMAVDGDQTPTNERLRLENLARGVGGGMVRMNVAFNAGADAFDQIIVTNGVGAAIPQTAPTQDDNIVLNIFATGNPANADDPQAGDAPIVLIDAPAGTGVAGSNVELGAVMINNVDQASNFQIGRLQSGAGRNDWVLLYTGTGGICPAGADGVFNCSGVVSGGTITGTGNVVVAFAEGASTTAAADITVSGGTSRTVNLMGGPTRTNLQGDIDVGSGGTLNLDGANATNGTLNWAGISGFARAEKRNVGDWTLTGTQTNAALPFTFTRGRLRLDGATITQPSTGAVDWTLNGGIDRTLEIVGANTLAGNFSVDIASGAVGIDMATSGDTTATNERLTLPTLAPSGGSVQMNVAFGSGSSDDTADMITVGSSFTGTLSLDIVASGDVANIDRGGITLITAPSGNTATVTLGTLTGFDMDDVTLEKASNGNLVLIAAGDTLPMPTGPCLETGGTFNCSGAITAAQSLANPRTVNVAAGTTTTNAARINFTGTGATFNLNGGTAAQGTTTLRGALVGGVQQTTRATLNLQGGAGTSGSMSLDGLMGFLNFNKTGAGSWTLTGANAGASSVQTNFNGGVLRLDGANFWSFNAVGVDRGEVLEVVGSSRVSGAQSSLAINAGGRVDLTADGANTNDSLWVQRLVANGGSVSLNVALVSGDGNDAADTITVSGLGGNSGIANTSAVTLNVAVTGNADHLDSGGVMLINAANAQSSAAGAFTGSVTLNGVTTSDLRVERDSSSGDWMLVMTQTAPTRPFTETSTCTESNGGATFTCTGTVAGTENLASSETLAVGSSPLTLSGALTVAGTVNVAGNNLTAQDMVTVANGGTLSIASGRSMTVADMLTISDGATFTNAGTLTVNRGGTVNVTGSHTTTGAIANSGTISLAGSSQDDRLTTGSLSGTGAVTLDVALQIGTDRADTIAINTSFTGAVTLNLNITGSVANLDSGGVLLIDTPTGTNTATVTLGTVSGIAAASVRVAQRNGNWMLLEQQRPLEVRCGDTAPTFTCTGTLNEVESLGDGDRVNVGSSNFTLARNFTVQRGGVLDVAGANLIAQAGLSVQSGGTLEIDAGRSLTVQNALTLVDGATFTNNGTLTVNSGGTVNVSGSHGGTSGTIANSGTISLAGSGQDERLSTGTLSGNGAVTLDVRLNSGTDSADTITVSNSFTGTVTLNLNVTGNIANIDSAGVLLIDAPNGSAGTVSFGTLSGVNAADVWLVPSNGNWMLRAAPRPLEELCGETAPTFNCTGTLEAVERLREGERVNVVSGGMTMEEAFTVQSGGTLNVMGGDLTVEETLAVQSGGVLEIGANRTLTLDTATFTLAAGATFTNDGEMTLSGGESRLGGGGTLNGDLSVPTGTTAVFTSSMTIDGSTVTHDGDITINRGVVVTLDGVTISGSGDVDNNGVLEIGGTRESTVRGLRSGEVVRFALGNTDASLDVTGQVQAGSAITVNLEYDAADLVANTDPTDPTDAGPGTISTAVSNRITFNDGATTSTTAVTGGAVTIHLNITGAQLEEDTVVTTPTATLVRGGNASEENLEFTVGNLTGNRNFAVEISAAGLITATATRPPAERAVLEGYAAALAELGRLGSLQERAGNRIWQGTPGRGVWAAVGGIQTTLDPDVSTTESSYDIQDLRFGFGVDAPIDTVEGLTIGGNVWLIQGDTDIKSPLGTGTIETEGVSLAATATYVGESGFYVDGQAQYAALTSDLDTAEEAIVSGNDGSSVSMSGEFGFAIPLGAMSLTPQAQLVWNDVAFNDFTATGGEQVALADGDGLFGRIGVAADREWSNQDGEGRVNGNFNLRAPFDAKREARLGAERVAGELAEIVVDVGLGASFLMDGTYAITADLSTAHGEEVEEYRGTVGLKIGF